MKALTLSDEEFDALQHAVDDAIAEPVMGVKGRVGHTLLCQLQAKLNDLAEPPKGGQDEP